MNWTPLYAHLLKVPRNARASPLFYLNGSKTPRCHRSGPTLRTSTTRRRRTSSWLTLSAELTESGSSTVQRQRTSSRPRLSRAEAGSASGGTPDTKSSTLKEDPRPSSSLASMRSTGSNTGTWWCTRSARNFTCHCTFGSGASDRRSISMRKGASRAQIVGSTATRTT